MLAVLVVMIVVAVVIGGVRNVGLGRNGRGGGTELDYGCGYGCGWKLGCEDWDWIWMRDAGQWFMT